MCGIIGVAAVSPVEEREWLVSGRDAMAHRGPDDAGVWWSSDHRVGLGHRRLAIIDLSPAGHQPMQNFNKSLTIVFNGEIYNYLELQVELSAKGHIFSSHSDTEVILAAYREWGEGCLSRLNGMFAFALYDIQQEKLFLARDRAGEKPLFYSNANGQFRFASELKALLADTASTHFLDRQSLDIYLAIGYLSGDRCIAKGVKKLPPAHALSFNVATGNTKVWQYWQLPRSPEREEIEPTALVDELESLLEDAVRRQLVADVPVGVLLSGGVDSSIITAMAIRSSSRVKTFTVGFDGFQKFDERDHARLISQHFGTEHIELNAGGISPDMLPILARQFDEPMVDSSMIPTFLVSHLVRQHCTVALGGDGGDELFGGYKHYNRLMWMKSRFGPIPQMLRKTVASSLGSVLPTGAKGRNWLQSLGCDFEHSLPMVSVLFDRNHRRRLMGGTIVEGWPLVAEEFWESRIPAESDFLQRTTRMDFHNYMAEDILVKVDRASMLNSLEVRAPLLDYRVIEFAFGRVPSNLKTTIQHRKILLKQLAARILPENFDRQRKQGFSIPLAEWLKAGTWRDFFHEVLFDSQCVFDKETTTKLIADQDKGKNNSERLFSLVVFELWRREYRMTV